MSAVSAAQAGDALAVQAAPRLRITEIFLSLQGEAATAGFPTVFVRLTGCPLRCRYCDTSYAFQGGESWSLDDVVTRVRGYGVRHVCVTGGEPLAQKACIPLLDALVEAGFIVSLETSGALPFDHVDTRVQRVVDLKSPASGEVARNRYDQLAALTPHDLVKFVICDRADYEWSRDRLREYGLPERCTVLMSPSHGELEPVRLAEWILEDRLPVRLQIQLHKLLWGNVPGR